jgi:hypothetical protein
VDLLARGFTHEEVRARGYRTLPLQGRARLARQAHNGNPERLFGVPGFYGATGDYWQLAGRPGLLIPCRAPDRRIRAFRIRPDNPGDSGGKYNWLSSEGKPGGAGSGAHCHVARPITGEPTPGVVWVVEGELKADLSSERLRAVVLSIPGASLWQRALPDIMELLPAGGRVVVALDADWRDKAPVHLGVWGLVQASVALGYVVEVALWETKYKGLDDLLTAGRHPERNPPSALPAPAWDRKVSSWALAEVPARAQTQVVTLAVMRRQLAEALTACPCPCN